MIYYAILSKYSITSTFVCNDFLFRKKIIIYKIILKSYEFNCSKITSYSEEDFKTQKLLNETANRFQIKDCSDTNKKCKKMYV